MDATVRPSRLAGAASAPPSKSYTHRAILAAGLSAGASVHHPLDSADTRATARAVRAFGGTVEFVDGGVDVLGVSGTPGVPDDVIDCANSGTTMRLTSGVAGLVDGITVLTGDASLRSRPQGPLLAALSSLGGRAESTRGTGEAPVVIKGPIDGGSVSMPGDVSSQYISALLIAGGVTESGIDITLETELKSAPYVDITLDVLARFGIEASRTAEGYRVDGGQQFVTDEPYTVPGDFSSISYLVAAGVVAGDPSVRITDAHPSAQGDTRIVDIVRQMGGEVEWSRERGELTARQSALEGVSVDVEDTPDLLPTIATLGAIADGTTRLHNCEHVRYKETDRVAAMASELERMGAVVEEEHDELTVVGAESELEGARVDGYHDHRIIMALSIAGLAARGETTIVGAEHVDVSFPNFFTLLERLGASLDCADGESG